MILGRYYSRIGKKKAVEEDTLNIYFATDAHVYADMEGDSENPLAVSGRRYFYTSGQKMQLFVNDVNENVPDLVFFGGDIVERYSHTGSLDLFMSKWNQINPSIQKELTIGNHDMASGGGAVANTDFATVVGYGDRPIIAGSKYNQSFYLGEINKKIKIISVDTNMTEDSVHVANTSQLLKKPVRDWVEQELLNSITDKVLIFSHGGMADYSGHFNPDDQIAFKNMIDDVALQRPELDMYSMFGHAHVLAVNKLDALGDNIKSYSLPAVVDNVIGKYTIIKVGESGVSFEVKSLNYVQL